MKAILARKIEKMNNKLLIFRSSSQSSHRHDDCQYPRADECVKKNYMDKVPGDRLEEYEIAFSRSFKNLHHSTLCGICCSTFSSYHF